MSGIGRHSRIVSISEEEQPLQPSYGRTATRTTSAPISRPPSATSAARFVALMPIAQTLLVAAHVFSLRGSTTWVFLWLVVGLGLGLSYVLARVDRDQLRRRGYERLPSPLWALGLPVCYLAIRARRAEEIDWEGYRPLWLHVGIIVLVVVIINVAGFWGSVASQLPSVPS